MVLKLRWLTWCLRRRIIWHSQLPIRVPIAISVIYEKHRFLLRQFLTANLNIWYDGFLFMVNWFEGKSFGPCYEILIRALMIRWSTEELTMRMFDLNKVLSSEWPWPYFLNLSDNFWTLGWIIFWSYQTFTLSALFESKWCNTIQENT